MGKLRKMELASSARFELEKDEIRKIDPEFYHFSKTMFLNKEMME